MSFRIGTDIGGTCTDTAVMEDNGRVHIGKSFSTYPDFSDGILNSLADAADTLGMTVEDLVGKTSNFFHATTIGENTIFEKDGARTGLITTKGFEETLHSTRGGYGVWSGITYQEAKDLVHAEKPDHVIPPDNIRGVSERTYQEEVLKPLSEQEVEEAVDELVDNGVEALACCFLWSFVSPEHEEQVQDLIEERYPDMYTSVSSHVVPSMGEYERTSATVLNSYLGPTTKQYLDNLLEKLQDLGFDGSMHLMFSHGGLVSRQSAVNKPIGAIESGPVSGLMGGKFIGSKTGDDHVLSTDMGGTTFKVGVIRNGRIEYADEPMVGQYHYDFPKRDVHSIPIAGGSIINLDESNVPTIGPESAGSDPGPICYDLGGDRPTVTDVDLIQGYFSPEFFLGGGREMDPEKAHDIFEAEVANPMDKSVEQAAADIYRLTNAIIADFIREITIEKGIDPRRFTIYAIGGTAGMHAAAYARELGVPEVLVPYTASVHSAFGLLSTDVKHEYVRVKQMDYPFDVDEINDIFNELTEDGISELESEGFSRDRIVVERSIGMRYKRQVHELKTPVETASVSEEDVSGILSRFEGMYGERYGRESLFDREEIEITELRVKAVGALSTPELSQRKLANPTPVEDAIMGNKDIYFGQSGQKVRTKLYDFTQLVAGNEMEGPCVILTPVTTIVAGPQDEVFVDKFKNVRIDVGGVTDGRN